MTSKQRPDEVTDTAIYNDELLAKFLAGITVQPHNTKKLFAVGYVGLASSGKSYVQIDALVEHCKAGGLV